MPSQRWQPRPLPAGGPVEQRAGPADQCGCQRPGAAAGGLARCVQAGVPLSAASAAVAPGACLQLLQRCCRCSLLSQISITVLPHVLPAATLRSCEFLRMRWGGPRLVVGGWVRHATALTCMALSAHNLRLDRTVHSLAGLAHLELSTVSGAVGCLPAGVKIQQGVHRSPAASCRHARAPAQECPHPTPRPPTADSGPCLQPACLPPSITRLCIVPAPVPPGLPPGGIMAAELPEQLLALPLAYLDVSESLFQGPHLAVALPRLTRLTSLALDKCELAGARWGKGCGVRRGEGQQVRGGGLAGVSQLGGNNVPALVGRNPVARPRSHTHPQTASHPSCRCSPTCVSCPLTAVRGTSTARAAGQVGGGQAGAAAALIAVGGGRSPLPPSAANSCQTAHSGCMPTLPPRLQSCCPSPGSSP